MTGGRSGSNPTGPKWTWQLSVTSMAASCRVGPAHRGTSCFHELRHCYATWVIQSGASVKDAMELARHSDPDLTLNTYAHIRLEDLARIVDTLPTSKMWASDAQCDFDHTLPKSCVSEGLNGTARNKAEMRPGAPEQVPAIVADKLPGQDSNLEKQDQNLL